MDVHYILWLYRDINSVRNDFSIKIDVCGFSFNSNFINREQGCSGKVRGLRDNLNKLRDVIKSMKFNVFINGFDN